jgi:hypothetical protein
MTQLVCLRKSDKTRIANLDGAQKMALHHFGAQEVFSRLGLARQRLAMGRELF